MVVKRESIVANYTWSRSEILLQSLMVLIMIFAGVHVVSEFSDKTSSLIDGLEDGWLFGRKIDLYDSQWHAFRSSLMLLSSLALFHIMCVNATRTAWIGMRYFVQLVFGMGFLLVLHGYKTVYILGIAILNYSLRYMFVGKRLVAAVWVFNLGALVVVSGTGESWPIPDFLKPYSGMEGWAHHFNMVILKMISFGIDYQRAVESGPSSKFGSFSYKERQEGNRTLSEYSLLYYVTYLCYAPLFIAGPIISFNAWQSQMLIPQKTYSVKGILMYGLRWVGVFFLMELFCHFNYSNAIAAQKGEAMDQIPSLLVALFLSVCVLFFMWLKFLLMWRFFRLWSLAAGIEAPENMTRCVLNNYSIALFWKGWHSSFNLWIVRYIYIPLGGSALTTFTRLLNILLVFTFVALWHDLDWRVFHWAFFVSAIFVPELVGGAIYGNSKFFKTLKLSHPYWCKRIVICAGSLNVFLLIACNLVGYVFGFDGLGILVRLAHRTATPVAVAFVCVCFYCAVSLMMYLERQKGEKSRKPNTPELTHPTSPLTPRTLSI